MGLGIFIAVTLLERSGATLEFGNASDGGARVCVRWPRTRFQQTREEGS
jgi:two-component system sensor histidine kinase RegB